MKRAHRAAGSALPRAGTGRGLPSSQAPPRPLPQVFSIVVFGSIVNEGYLNTPSEGEEFCIYNRNPNACSYGVTVGVLAFLTCLLYLALDVYFPQISSVKDRKKAVLSDIGVSGESPRQRAPPPHRGVQRAARPCSRQSSRTAVGWLKGEASGRRTGNRDGWDQGWPQRGRGCSVQGAISALSGLFSATSLAEPHENETGR